MFGMIILTIYFCLRIDRPQVVVRAYEGDPWHGVGGREGLAIGRQPDEANHSGAVAEDVGGTRGPDWVHHHHCDKVSHNKCILRIWFWSQLYEE